MKNPILISAILFTQFLPAALAQEGLGQSEWVTPGSYGSASAQAELINSGLSGELSGQPSNEALEQPSQLGQSAWMQPGAAGSSATQSGLGQSGWMQPGQDVPAGGQLGQSAWMQPGAAGSSTTQSGLGQSGWMQPKQDPGNSEISGMVRKDVPSGGGKLSALADSLGSALQAPMLMAGAARMMGYGFAPVYATPFGFAPVYGFGSYMPMSKGAAWTGVGTYMAGRAIRGMLNGR